MVKGKVLRSWGFKGGLYVGLMESPRAQARGYGQAWAAPASVCTIAVEPLAARGL